MIGRLRGKLIEKKPPYLLLEVGGVGYEVQAPLSTCFRLPQEDNEVVLYTHFVVREDAQLLYGFDKVMDRELFRRVTRVSGVGPKVGLAILSGMETQHFVQVVMDSNTSQLVKLPGIGKKTAERLVVEMRDALPAWLEANCPDISVERGRSSLSVPVMASSAEAEAISALMSLGYKQKEADRAVAKVANREDLSCEAIIKQALQGISTA